MQLVLQVRNGPGNGHVFQLKTGQTARVGRSEWCEFPLPNADLADEHFVVECGNETPTIRNVAAEGETCVNGDPVAESPLADGDVVTAGSVQFAVFVVGAPESAANPAAAEVVPVEAGPATPPEIAEAAGLSEAGKSLAATAGNVGDLLGGLEEAEEFGDAVRLLANVLEKPAAVEWAANCVREAAGGVLPEADGAALDAALAWASDSSEPNRRAASVAAEATDYSTGATWVALAAFWSGGSLAPEGLPDAPPDEGLTAQGVTGALMMAATSSTTDDPNDLYRRFVVAGRERLDA